MRTISRRPVTARLELVVVLAILLAGALPALTTWAQDSGATSFTIASSNGNVVIKRADGSAEMARPGTVLRDGDQLASVGRSEAMVNLGAQAAGGSGATLLLFSDTTLGIRGAGNGTTTGNRSGGGGFFVADIASGVVLARSLSSSNATIQITNESAGAVAQLNPGGGMAVSTDVGTGTIAVGCEDRTSKVFFPYVDDRVPCENNVVRTLSNQRSIEDSAADSNSPVTSAVQAAGTNVAAVQQQENAAQTTQHTTAQQQDKDDVPVAIPSPNPSTNPTPTPTPTAPVSYFFNFRCVNNPSTFTSACTASASGLLGAQVGGQVSIAHQMKDSVGNQVTETDTCGPITSALTVSCSFNSPRSIFQGSVWTFTTPLAAGGTSTVSETAICNTTKPAGAVC